MKNKLMERPLLGGVIRQSIETHHLCLTDLSNLYESIRNENNWVEKDLSHFFSRSSEVEYIIELLELQGVFVKLDKHSFIEKVKNQGLLKSLKSIGHYKVTGRGDNKAMFCNEYIFIAIAQWLNPKFRAVVTMWVTDQLILNRIEAGHEYTLLCDSITEHINSKLSDNGKKFIYSNFAKLINRKVFGKHTDDLRQIASKTQLQELNKLQTKLATLIEVGYISSYQEAVLYINK